MEWKKAPEELKALLDTAMQGVECEKRPMFGYPAYFINRNMFIGLFQDQLFMRLSESTRASLDRRSVALRNLEPMPGRPMKDYFVIPPEVYTRPQDLRQLVGEATEHARTLRPKAMKPGKPPRPKTAQTKPAKLKTSPKAAKKKRSKGK